MEKRQKRLNIKLNGLICVLILLIMATSGFAQNGKVSNNSSEANAQIMTDKQKEKIYFYKDQEQQMFDINLKYVKEMEVIGQGGRSLATYRKLRNMIKRKDKEVKKVLDKEQYKIYQKQKGDLRSQMKANRGR